MGTMPDTTPTTDTTPTDTTPTETTPVAETTTVAETTIAPDTQPSQEAVLSQIEDLLAALRGESRTSRAKRDVSKAAKISGKSLIKVMNKVVGELRGLRKNINGMNRKGK